MFRNFLFISFTLISTLIGVCNFYDGSQCKLLCDIEESQTSIVLIGENHGNEYHKNLGSYFENLAEQGEIYLALEGYDTIHRSHSFIDGLYLALEKYIGIERSKSLIYPLETYNVARDLASGCTIYHVLISSTNRFRNIKFIKNIFDNAYDCDVIKMVLDKNKHLFPELAVVLEEMITNCVKFRFQSDASFLDNLPQNFIYVLDNNQEFIELAKAYVVELARLFQKELNLLDEELKCVYDLIEDPLDPKKANAVTFFTLPYRDFIMACNLVQLYCKAKPSSKSVYAIMGQLHLKGVKEYLEQVFDGKVQIVVMDLIKSTLDLPKSEL